MARDSLSSISGLSSSELLGKELQFFRSPAGVTSGLGRASAAREGLSVHARDVSGCRERQYDLTFIA